MTHANAFPLNAWYAAAWSHEVEHELAARRICDQDVVLYRRTDGQVTALEDACWHRLLPLSMGRLEGDQVICGYHVPDGLMVTLGGVKVSLDPKRTMMFRIQAIDVGRGQVRVHPVAAVGPDGVLASTPTDGLSDQAWQRSGPTVALRLEMRLYRWCITFGEMVLNWDDL